MCKSPCPPLTFYLSSIIGWFGASLVAQMVKNPPAMQKTWLWSLSWEDPLEKGMATHSSTLTWRIPWSEEPGGLQSMGFERVGHNWATNTHTQDDLDPLLGMAVSSSRGDLAFKDWWFISLGDYLWWLFCVIIFLPKYHQSRSLFLVSAASQLSIVHLPGVLLFS